MVSLRLWGVLALLLPLAAAGAEAPVEIDPLPPQAEAAYQDVKIETRAPVWLDEAVFTEISPVTVPEQGVRLPDDQEL